MSPDTVAPRDGITSIDPETGDGGVVGEDVRVENPSPSAARLTSDGGMSDTNMTEEDPLVKVALGGAGAGAKTDPFKGTPPEDDEDTGAPPDPPPQLAEVDTVTRDSAEEIEDTIDHADGVVTRLSEAGSTADSDPVEPPADKPAGDKPAGDPSTGSDSAASSSSSTGTPPSEGGSDSGSSVRAADVLDGKAPESATPPGG